MWTDRFATWVGRLLGQDEQGRGAGARRPAAEPPEAVARTLDDLCPLFGRREFWTDYCWITEEGRRYPELRGCQLSLPIDEARALLLGLDEGLFEATLWLRDGESAAPVQLGWDDQAHWHPHLLRWAELDAVCRCLAVRQPDYPHPGVPLLLLCRFVALGADDDVPAVQATLAAAWRRLGLFDEGEIASMSTEKPWLYSQFAWLDEPARGWLLTGEEAPDGTALYSLRHAENADFPFARLNALLLAARTAAGCE